MSEQVYYCTQSEYNELQQELRRIQRLLQNAVIRDAGEFANVEPLSDVEMMLVFGAHYHSIMYYNFDVNAVGLGVHWQKKSAVEGGLGWRDVHNVHNVPLKEYQTLKAASKNNRFLLSDESVAAWVVVPVTQAVYETAKLVNPDTVFKRASLTSKHVFGCYVMRNTKTGELRRAPWIKCPYNRDVLASDCLYDALMWGVRNVARSKSK